MLAFRITLDTYLVNRPVESVFSNKLLRKINLTYIYRYQVIVSIRFVPKILLTFSEIISKPKGALIDLIKRNMFTFRTTFDTYLVNRPLESVFPNELLQKVTLTYL